ncbi:hypothetical protein PG999_011535 [Apiospora kogelbergensis]|uniref:Uncharacterized protein n=1 Tax=Apiospora kogelbergensis TaxID=1337665 RepID=A0AAW0QFP8_9PEZI
MATKPELGCPQAQVGIGFEVRATTENPDHRLQPAVIKIWNCIERAKRWKKGVGEKEDQGKEEDNDDDDDGDDDDDDNDNDDDNDDDNDNDNDDECCVAYVGRPSSLDLTICLPSRSFGHILLLFLVAV